MTTMLDLSIIGRFPKVRAPLPAEYEKAYEALYSHSRKGESLLSRGALWLEQWMHQQVAADRRFPLLELGAGTLNHVPFELGEGPYDAVEPQEYLYRESSERSRVRDIFPSVDAVPADRNYQRIVSIAVLEHVLDLPAVVAKLANRCTDDGVFLAGIPSEGALAWFLAWRFGTGLSFKRRFKLDYSVFMRHEHVNTAREIEALVRTLFQHVKIRRYPLPFFHGSFYTYVEAKGPRRDVAQQVLAHFGQP